VRGDFQEMDTVFGSTDPATAPEPDNLRRIRLRKFPVRSSINGRFATSGAGTAAYRFCRLVRVPELSMSSIRLSRRRRAALAVSTIVAGLMSAVAIAGTDDAISVTLDQAKLIKLPQDVATVVVGNPLIADVTLQAGGMVVVTGKGYGATNVIAMDRKGTVVTDRVIQVEGPSDKVVTVYRGLNRESYSCLPLCERRVTLGDAESYFKAAIDQTGTLNTQATAASTTAKAN
jgi:hypothetical protein